MTNFDYEYSPGQEYSETGYGSKQIAIYHEAINASNRGNPFIEALPEPLTDDDIQELCKTPICVYDPIRVSGMTDIQKRFQLSDLKRFRVPLPFISRAAFEFARVLNESYASRKVFKIISGGQDTYQSCGNPGSSAVEGFGIIGKSGCGKSTAVGMITEKYPQVIYHNLNGCRIPQIVFLTVSCPPHSNIKAILVQIAREIDKALGVDIYAKVMDRNTSLGVKSGLLCKWIEQFNVGVIFLDEIQNVDFQHTKEASFEIFMNITNMTKLPFCVLGTEDAYEKMFAEVRTGRRIGTIIPASIYCKNLPFYSFIVTQMFKYQYFDSPVTLTQDMIEAFHDETSGIVSQTIKLYTAVHDEYLTKRNRPKITADFIRKVSHETFPNLRELLKKDEDDSVRKEIEDIIKAAGIKREEELEEAQQELAMKYIANLHEPDADSIHRQVVANLTQMLPSYSTAKIESTVYEAMNSVDHSDKKKIPAITEKAIMLLINPEIKTPKPRKRPKKTHEDMITEIFAE